MLYTTHIQGNKTTQSMKPVPLFFFFTQLKSNLMGGKKKKRVEERSFQLSFLKHRCLKSEATIGATTLSKRRTGAKMSLKVISHPTLPLP